MKTLVERRKILMHNFRTLFYNLSVPVKESIFSFLTTINREIVCAKAMFLSYSDPFEKYRALLFEYAHTLGHGVEAFTNDLIFKARKNGLEILPNSVCLHGQFVGMAVLWAGEMSKNLGKLVGNGYILHQSIVYLFNRSGGFSFQPIRELCDQLGVGRNEFCENVLQVVRRDNKRGYCDYSDSKKSVDQLVTCRPGKMLRSSDANAEIRYLVEVDEEWQRQVLKKAFDGHFDNFVDIRNGGLVFRSLSEMKHDHLLMASSKNVSSHIKKDLLSIYDSC